MRKRALILGIGGQDGSYLAELLLAEGYEVAGIVRRSPESYPNLANLPRKVEIFERTTSTIACGVSTFQPDEFYNLASHSFVPRSWEEPLGTIADMALVAEALEAVRTERPETRFYQACSSEIFGSPTTAPQNEETPMRPVTPYGAAKAHARYLVEIYRRAHGLFACCGIAYNHESPRRSPEFLPRKVAIAVARGEDLALGDISARRDWGYAPDYVRAMAFMLRADEPDDYVLATGESHSVRELVECAYDAAGPYRREIAFDPTLLRAVADPVGLVGDASRARERLGWEPSTRFDELVDLLVDAEVKKIIYDGALA